MDALTTLKQFVNCPTAAKLLGITPTAVRSLADRGHLPGSLSPTQSPSGQWLIPLASVEARKLVMREESYDRGGYHAHKANRTNDLRTAKRHGRKSKK